MIISVIIKIIPFITINNYFTNHYKKEFNYVFLCSAMICRFKDIKTFNDYYDYCFYRNLIN